MRRWWRVVRRWLARRRWGKKYRDARVPCPACGQIVRWGRRLPRHDDRHGLSCCAGRQRWLALAAAYLNGGETERAEERRCRDARDELVRLRAEEAAAEALAWRDAGDHEMHAVAGAAADALGDLADELEAMP